MNLTSLSQSRKLKEWGAPQDTTFFWRKVSGDQFIVSMKADLDIAAWTEHYAAYSLEDLIMWMGDGFQCLQHNTDRWEANSRWGMKKHSEDSRFWEYGQTPLEAVFNLCEAMMGKEGE